MGEENNKDNGAKNILGAASKGMNAVEGVKKAAKVIKKVPIIAGICSMILICVIISSLIQIIFTALGYNDCGEYVEDSAKIEGELLEKGVADMFSYSETQEIIDNAMFQYDGTRFSVTGLELPADGIGKPCYDQIEKDYKNEVEEFTTETVIYDGYTVVNDYDSFWDNNTYLKYMVPIIQSKHSTSDIKYLLNYEKNKGKGNYVKKIKKIAQNMAGFAKVYGWFEVVENEDTVTTEKVPIPSETNLEQLDGTEPETDDIYHFDNSVETNNPAETEETEYEETTHIIKNYQIKLKKQSDFKVNGDNYSYKLVTDEDTIGLVTEILQILASDDYENILSKPADVIKTLWKSLKSSFQKLFSWRELTNKDNSDGYSTGAQCPDYANATSPGGGVGLDSLVDGWLQLYDGPTVAGSAYEIPITSSLGYRSGCWPMGEGTSVGLNQYMVSNYSDSACLIGPGGIGYVNGSGRYWVAVGPKVTNPDFKVEYDGTGLTAGECLPRQDILFDVVLTDGTNTYYLPCVSGDAKAHTYPSGVVQTGVHVSNGEDFSSSNNDSSVVEFCGVAPKTASALRNTLEIVKIVVYM